MTATESYFTLSIHLRDSELTCNLTGFGRAHMQSFISQTAMSWLRCTKNPSTGDEEAGIIDR